MNKGGPREIDILLAVRRWIVVSLALAACRAGTGGTPDAGPPRAVTVGSLEPPNGAPGGAGIVFITGEGFDPRAPVEVMFGDKKAPRAVVLSATRIQAQTPAGVHRQAVPVRVILPGGASIVAKGTYYYGFPEEEDGEPHDHEAGKH